MYLIKSLIFASAILFSGTAIATNVGVADQMVYVCTKSGASYAYHTNANCQHIKRCWEEDHIDKMSLEKAKKMQRTLCKTCAKHR